MTIQQSRLTDEQREELIGLLREAEADYDLVWSNRYLYGMAADAIEEVARERAAGWQPIETAPSDVTVLLFSPWRHATNPERVEAAIYRDTRGGSSHAWATHWMPMPAAPTQEGEQA